MPDIVKNLKQAPLLVQIYSGLDGGVRIETEKAVAEEWPAAREGWRSGESKSPDGLIFVVELERERESESELGVTRAWEIVVQGKGDEVWARVLFAEDGSGVCGCRVRVLHPLLLDEGE